MSDQKKELMLRAEAKMKELKANLAKAKADAKSSSNEKSDKLERQVSELTEAMKEASDNFTESVAKKINSWLK